MNIPGWSARRTLPGLEGLPVLAATEAVADLAGMIARDLALPPKAANDAIHIAFAAVHGVDFLLTWNCTHIANATFRGRIRAACTAYGHRPPEIATPEQLLKEGSDVG